MSVEVVDVHLVLAVVVHDCNVDGGNLGDDLEVEVVEVEVVQEWQKNLCFHYCYHSLLQQVQRNRVTPRSADDGRTAKGAS